MASHLHWEPGRSSARLFLFLFQEHIEHVRLFASEAANIDTGTSTLATCTTSQTRQEHTIIGEAHSSEDRKPRSPLGVRRSYHRLSSVEAILRR